MSRGFDLIRRHLVGRKAGEREPVSSPQGPAGPLVVDRPEDIEAGSDGDFARGPGAAPPPFDPVRVAATPPPPKPSRPRPKPRKVDIGVPAEPGNSPSRTLRDTRLPEILRPRDEPRSGASPETAVPPPSPSPEPVAAPEKGSGPQPQPAATAGSQRLAASVSLPRQNHIPNPAASPVASQPHPNTSPDQSKKDFPASQRQVDQTGTAGSIPPRARPPQTRRIDKANARAARRHSIFVALMKGLLPSLVLGLAAVFFFFSYDFQPVSLPDNIKFDPGKVSVGTEGIRMVAPKLTGVDEKQQTFEIKADEAVQDRANPAKVTLVGIDARINLTDGGTIGFSAQKGVYNTDLNQIWLSEELEVRSSEGYVAQLSEAQIDFKNGLMVSNSPVLIFTNDGVINASGIQVLDGGKKVIFSGRVSLNLNGSAGETQ